MISQPAFAITSKFKTAKIWVALLALILILPGLCLASPEKAEAPAAQAEAHLEKLVAEVLEIIRDPQLTLRPKDQEQVLYDKAFEIFDFQTFSMLALGPKYRSFSVQQRDDFILYFSKLISKTYFPKLAGKDVHNLTVLYLKNTPLAPKQGVHRTDIETELIQGELRVPIVYRMIRKNKDPWKIYDVKIEGVSMAANYREQYRQQISATPDQIITQLKEKLAQ